MVPGEQAPENHHFVVYVAGETPTCQVAVNNLRHVCGKYLADRYSIEVIDVGSQPEAVTREQILALPMVVRKAPPPERRLIGDLSDFAKVLRALGLANGDYDDGEHEAGEELEKAGG